MLEHQIAGRTGKEFIDDAELPISFRRGNPFALEQKAFVKLPDSDDRWVASGSLTTESEEEHVPGEDAASVILDRQVNAALADLEQYPENPFLLNNAGMAYLKAGKFDEAADYFKRALERDPDLITAKETLAKILTNKNQLDDARSIYDSLLRSEPANVTLLMNAAQLYMQNRDFAEAEKLLDKVVSLNASNASNYNNRGVVRLLQGRIKEAASDFRKATTLNVRDAASHNNLGVCHFLLRNSKKGFREYKLALALNPLEESAINNFARLCLTEQLAAEAIPFLVKYVSYREDDIENRIMLARAYSQIENFPAAIKRLSEAMEIAQRTKAHNQIISILNDLGVVYGLANETDRAEDVFQRCLALEPTNHVVLNNFGNLLIGQFRLAEAKALLDKSLHIRRDDAMTLTLIGVYHAMREEYEMAVKYYQTAIAINPRHTAAHGLLSSIAVDIYKDFKLAFEVIHQGLKHKPNEPRLLNNLAYSYLMTNEIAKARAALDRVPEKAYSVTLTATRGLLLLKEGNALEASRLYNKAASMAKDAELRNMVMQKKNLELARHALTEGDLRKAERFIKQGLKFRTNDKIFIRQLSTVEQETEKRKMHINETSKN